MIRVVVADDHGVLRDGLAGVISAQSDMELVATAANGAEAVDLCRSNAPDVVLMDLEMPVLDGIEATKAIMAEAPSTAVLVLTSFSDRRRITGALDAGAVGSLLKDASADDVVRAAHPSTRAPRVRCSTPTAPPIRSPASHDASARCSGSCSTGCPTS
jgi:DNA-binding NarL/FixJ family response regulator